MTTPTDAAAMRACTCISYNLPHPDETTPEVVLTLPDFMRTEQRDTVCVDACIVGLVQQMWAARIVTLGSCCGHSGRHQRNIIVNLEQRKEAEAIVAQTGDTAVILAWELVPSLTLPAPAGDVRAAAKVLLEAEAYLDGAVLDTARKDTDADAVTALVILRDGLSALAQKE